MAINYPYEMRPRHFKDVVLQTRAVQTIQAWLASGNTPSFIFTCGHTGVGKSLLMKLLVQATHCLNREVGGVDTCGHCAVCLSDPQLSSGYANVVWVAAEAAKDADGKEITYQRSIVEALHAADRGPSSTGHPHRDILYIVFEEAHLMPKDLFQRCLARADASNPFVREVVLIFLTMSPEEMPDRARQAISQRGAILQLDTPSASQIASYISARFNLSEKIASRIASGADGSIRGALSLYKDCLDYANPLTLASVSLKLGFLVEHHRQALWSALVSKLPPRDFKLQVDALTSGIERTQLARQLQDDLDSAYNLLGEELWWSASKILEQFFRRPDKLSLTYTLLNLRALNFPPDFYRIKSTANVEFVKRLLTEPWTDLHK